MDYEAYSVDLTGDSKKALISGLGGIELWDVSREPAVKLRVLKNGVFVDGAIFAGNDQFVVANVSEAGVQIWNANTPYLASQSLDWTPGSTSIRFASCSQSVVAVLESLNTLYLFDPVHRELIRRLPMNSSYGHVVSMSRDGTRILVGNTRSIATVFMFDALKNVNQGR